MCRVICRPLCCVLANGVIASLQITATSHQGHCFHGQWIRATVSLHSLCKVHYIHSIHLVCYLVICIIFQHMSKLIYNDQYDVFYYNSKGIFSFFLENFYLFNFFSSFNRLRSDLSIRTECGLNQLVKTNCLSTLILNFLIRLKKIPPPPISNTTTQLLLINLKKKNNEQPTSGLILFQLNSFPLLIII